MFQEWPPVGRILKYTYTGTVRVFSSLNNPEIIDREKIHGIYRYGKRDYAMNAVSTPSDCSTTAVFKADDCIPERVRDVLY